MSLQQTHDFAINIEDRSWLHSLGPLANRAIGAPNMVDAIVDQEGRVCTRCKQWKPIYEFGQDKRRLHHARGGAKCWCRSCTSEQAKIRRISEPEVLRAQERASWRKHFDVNGPKKRVRTRHWHLKNKFGISFENLMTMLDEQNHKCAICGVEIRAISSDPGKGDVACVDHDHDTGKVRGLLCNPCNRGIGGLQDSVKILESAAAYLRKNSRGDN